MKTRLLLLLTGLAISQTAFGAIATLGKNESASKTKTLRIALHRNPQFEEQYFQEIKNALDEAGYSTTIAWDPKNLKGSGIDLGVAFVFGEPNAIGICHNENRLMAKCIGNELGRRTTLELFFLEWEESPFMQPGDPVLMIFVDPSDIEKRCDRYIRGFVEGVEEYADELN